MDTPSPLEQAARALEQLSPSAAEAILRRLPDHQVTALRSILASRRTERSSSSASCETSSHFIAETQSCEDSNQPSHALADTDGRSMTPASSVVGREGGPMTVLISDDETDLLSDEFADTLFGQSVASRSLDHPPRDEEHASLQALLRLDDATIHQALMHERASVSAALLSVLPSRRAASLLKRFSPGHRTRLLDALLGRHAIMPGAVQAIADAIVLHHTESRRVPTMAHYGALEAIFRELDEAERVDMLRDLAQDNPLLASRLLQVSSPHVSGLPSH